MNAQELCTKLKETTPALFECLPAPIEGIQVRTPLVLPDGDIVDVFVVEGGDGFVVTDFGGALGWLHTQSIRGKLTPRQRYLLDDICMTLGIELDRGQLTLRLGNINELGDAVQRIAQAVVRVTDLWFTFRTQGWEAVGYEIDEWFQDKEITFERRAKSTGYSGRQWTVDYKATMSTHTSLVFLLATGTRGAVHRITDRVFTGCSDLSASRLVGTTDKLVSLFDDTIDVWRAEDFALLENVSEIARWSSPEEFEEILKTPV